MNHFKPWNATFWGERAKNTNSKLILVDKASLESSQDQKCKTTIFLNTNMIGAKINFTPEKGVECQTNCKHKKNAKH